MGAIMGMGSTHWPAMIQPDEAKPWPFLRTLARDPRIPEALQHRENWPEGVQREYGEDEGVSAHREHRRQLVEAFRKMRAEIEAFQPDFILMFGDDQYENFTEDIIPPFCIMAYDDLTSYPFKEGRRGSANVWGEPQDHPIKTQSRPDIAKWLARRYLEEGVDMSYAYKPLHWEGLGHAFVNIQMYLDYDRKGFDYPIVPIQVNSYGSKIIRNKRAINGAGQEPDPISPTPKRCFEIGQITARILQDSPWRVVLYASGGWSHGFLVEKNHCLWPDVQADRGLVQQIREGREAEWKNLTVAAIEDAGQQEVMTWICVAGAMHELGQKGTVVDYVETAGVFNSGKCLAVWRP
ncbi:MAG: extradiol ring-cleavage dioxygenase [Candidatus Tectomicrobia bacterium]|uniref:Extradiol ring-cleavage dioxygenase n=1 Tax=Tectimicrobiota bacterium TaxID=2528274 RepID=A0A937W3I7_UNCTE|nr:extradiol ring-cleavage dioxygenase [Candidatus Tectomicrobia bacterium]